MGKNDKLLIGPRIKKLRKALGISQVQMAHDLDVSPAYMNLIERNQRPLSANVLLRLAQVYDINMSDLADGSDNQTIDDLLDVLRDPALEVESLSKNEVEDLVNASPDIAKAFIGLHQKYRDLSRHVYSDENPLVDRDKVELLEGVSKGEDAVREMIHSRRNYFETLDEAAEELAEELGLVSNKPSAALVNRLRQKHGLKVRILPVEVMPTNLKYFDRHRGGLDMSEILSESGQKFQYAFHLGMLEYAELIDDIVRKADLPDRSAIGLARVSLGNYFAGALIMPYKAFLKECERTKYDVELLSHRFGCSYEQVTHRLTTLQRPDAKGIPFFFVRADVAGNVSKRFSAGRFHFAKFGGACPLWNIHQVFQIPGQIHTQIIQMPDEQTYFSIARTISRAGATFDQPATLLAIGLGCDIAYAPQLTYSRNHDLENLSPTQIGVNCYLCERPNCTSRAHPPLRKQLIYDERARGISLYHFDDKSKD